MNTPIQDSRGSVSVTAPAGVAAAAMQGKRSIATGRAGGVAKLVKMIQKNYDAPGSHNQYLRDTGKPTKTITPQDAITAVRDFAVEKLGYNVGINFDEFIESLPAGTIRELVEDAHYRIGS